MTTDAQAALAQVREALAHCRFGNDGFVSYSASAWSATCNPHTLRAILAHVEAQAAENEQLREMLAHLYAGSALYCDDGELQDNRASPFIDFKRDSVADIRSAMVERGEQR